MGRETNMLLEGESVDEIEKRGVRHRNWWIKVKVEISCNKELRR